MVLKRMVMVMMMVMMMMMMVVMVMMMMMMVILRLFLMMITLDIAGLKPIALEYEWIQQDNPPTRLGQFDIG